jgi:uncharacterized protein YndB with AHSA1/START domain
MIKKILIGLLALIAGFLAIVALQPADYAVSRSITIPAPPAVVFDLVNDLKKWNTWSPWAKRDPEAKYTYSGPENGKGASFSWAGNDQVGEGAMTISESVPGELVRYDLEFKKPMEDRASAEIVLKSSGSGTEVTWSMKGTNNFIGKLFGLLMNFDKMIGGDFEQGLANLKDEAAKAGGGARPN